ncbi:hypothetical protein DSO57_1020259 [Entomophthora muscae]|uniref:Uncharacterized protein n=1 Tax=Entomophthora muscae TaxID=34485 RepID=A0ACC2UQ81_9FUNG|nr:hypothetical protein DSO57_1020259 [Entomophthora muscae]
MNNSSCSLEHDLVKEFQCQYHSPSTSGCSPDEISLNSETLQTDSCSGPPNPAQNISEAVHSHSGMALWMSKIEHVLSSLIPTQMNQHVALEFYDHQQKNPKPEDIHNSCTMGFSALQDTVKAQEIQMDFLEDKLVLAFQKKKEWLDELDTQHAFLDSLQDQLSKHLEDASANSTLETLMGLHGNAKADSSPSQKISISSVMNAISILVLKPQESIPKPQETPCINQDGEELTGLPATKTGSLMSAL